MNMDQTVLNWIFAAAGAGAGWVLKLCGMRSANYKRLATN